MFSPANPEDYPLIEVHLNSSFIEILLKDLWMNFKLVLLPELVANYLLNVDAQNFGK